MTQEEKHRFYESAAKRFKAELKLYGATAAIHLENKNDEVFWSRVMRKAYPQGKFRFIASSRSHTGNDTCGCTQCLQYLDFLDEKFWIAIDSDYRYLGEEWFMHPKYFVLQTYVYSFENHLCFSANMNRALQQTVAPYKIDFDFDAFLKEYSFIIYPIMVWQLYLADIDPDAFPKSVFHRMLNIKVPGDFYKKNGDSVLDILRDRSRKFQLALKKRYPDADYTWHEARCNELGVRRDNAYLFVRGHNLYDLVEYMGRKLVSRCREHHPDLQGGASFESNLNRYNSFGQYPEIIKLVEDVNYCLGNKV